MAEARGWQARGVLLGGRGGRAGGCAGVGGGSVAGGALVGAAAEVRMSLTLPPYHVVHGGYECPRAEQPLDEADGHRGEEPRTPRLWRHLARTRPAAGAEREPVSTEHSFSLVKKKHLDHD